MKNPILSIDDFKKLQDNPNLVVFDVRVGADAPTQYRKKHIKGARFLDLEKDLAEVPEDAANGGRHPLPSVEKFQEALEHAAVSDESILVVYDDKGGANAAARLWWMLKSFDFDEVYILNGGFQNAEKHEVAMESGEPIFEKGRLTPRHAWLLPTKSISEVEMSLKNNEATVIDVRDAYRYRGESEPIDLVAGHIPGAINIPFSENLNDAGEFLPVDELRTKYVELLKSKPEKLIVHCGSGVTACHSILALSAAGFEMPSLYVGSWSEWSRTSRPIAKDV